MTSVMTGSSSLLAHAPSLLAERRAQTPNGTGSQVRRNSTGSSSRHSNKQKWVMGSSLQPTDVLFGRGCGPSRNKGNILFRHLVKQRKHQYKTAKCRREKHRHAIEILNAIQTRGGRFLRDVTYADRKFLAIPDSIQDVWCLVDDKSSLYKIKQVLRQKVDYKDSSDEESNPMDAHEEHEPLNQQEVNQGHSEASWNLMDQSNILLSAVPRQVTLEDAHEEDLEPLDWQENNQGLIQDVAWTILESDQMKTLPSLLSSPDSSDDKAHEEEEQEPLQRPEHDQDLSDADWTFNEDSDETQWLPSLLSSSASSEDEDLEPANRMFEALHADGDELIPASWLVFDDDDAFEE